LKASRALHLVRLAPYDPAGRWPVVVSASWPNLAQTATWSNGPLPRAAGGRGGRSYA
jgi:hypothetical protein